MYFAITLLIAIVPIFFICLYIYHEDRYEKESISLLILLFVSGVLGSFISFFAKNAEHLLLNNVFSEYISYSRDGIMTIADNVSWLYNLILAVFAYSLTDIVIVTMALFSITYKNKNFNSLFDGIVYAVYIVMGFAFVEVVLFGYGKGWDLLAMKCLITLPMRMFTAAIMGYYYSKMKIYHLASKEERKIHTAKLSFKYGKWLLFTIGAPWVIWGVFEFSTLMNGAVWRYLYYFVLIAMGFYTIRKITKTSNEDALFDEIIAKMVSDKDKV